MSSSKVRASSASSSSLRSCLNVFLMIFLSLSSCFSPFAAISFILKSFWRFPCGSYSRCVSPLSLLSPAHPSQGRLPSICPEFSSSSICHSSFDRRPPRLRTACGVWIWNSNPSLTIRHTFRSWLVSISHCSFSLLTRVPFSEGKRKRHEHTMHSER